MTVLTFPSNPQNGDTYSATNGTLYTYDGVKWVVTTTTITSDTVANFVQDSVAPIFENITGNGINFTYDADNNTLSANVVGSQGYLGFIFSDDPTTAITLTSNDAGHVMQLYGGDFILPTTSSEGEIYTFVNQGTTNQVIYANQSDGSIIYWGGADNIVSIEVQVGETVEITSRGAGSWGDGGTEWDITGGTVLIRLNGGGNANTGDFTFAGPAVRTPNDATLAIESYTGGEGGLDPYLRADLELNSSTADARLASWTKAVAEFREEWSNWQTATWNDNGNGYGNLVFSGATGLFNLFNTNIQYADNITISVNDGTPFAMNNGWGSGDVGSINIGTSGGFTLDPATVTKIVITYYARASVTANGNGGGVRIQGGEGSVYVNSLYDVNLNSNRISLLTTANSGGVTIATDQGPGGTNKSWSFNADGSLSLPYNGTLNQGMTRTRSASGSFTLPNSAVIWSSSSSYISSAKLVIQIEAEETGDASGIHSQTCEAVISSRGWINGIGEPVMTVYGVVHTSVAELATFTVQRNATTKVIEVLATPTLTAAAGGAYYGVSAVEITTWD